MRLLTNFLTGEQMTNGSPSPRVDMYTSYGEPSTAHSVAEPSGGASAAPNTSAMSLKTNLNVDSMTPLPHRMGPPPTSSPAMQGTHSPHSAGAGHAVPTQATNSWPIDGMKDGHLSGSEPRIYPGMISRRHRSNSLRQSSTHESDERATAKQAISGREASGEESAAEKE